MRIRHLGIQPFWATVNTIDVDDVCPLELAPHTLTRAAACLWWWRVKSWSFSGTVSWDNDIDTGGGSFSGVILPADGALQFESQRTGDEKDLLHRLYFTSETLHGGTGGGDVQDASISLTIGDVNTYRYRNPQKVPAYATREFRPDSFTFSVGITNTDGVDIGSFVAADYEFGDGGPDAAFYLRIALADGEVFAVPHEWYPYLDHDGANPIWDASTGAQLIDPRNDSQNWPS